MRLLLPVALGLLIAGCLVPAVPTAHETQVPATFGGEVSKVRLPAAAVDLTHAIDTTHGGAMELHAAPGLHTGSFGLELIGYSPLTELSNDLSATDKDSGFAAIDTWHDAGHHYACVTRFNGAGGATIVDLQDPTKPHAVSSIDSGMVNSDCQFTDDGNYLLTAAYAGASPGIPGVPPPVGDLAGDGIDVYDVRDKAHPAFLFQDSQGASPTSATSSAYHNLFTATINGTIYVFQTYTGNILTFKPGDTKLTMVSKVERADHDMWVGHHPLTGRWIMATGYKSGTALYDVGDPVHPKLLGTWASHDGFTGWHRQWPLMNTVDGHALLVVAGEDCGGGNSLPYTVLDITDPTQIEELGHWQVPGNPKAPPDAHLCEFSPHEFETWDGYVASGNYHSGVWVFDVGSMERAKAPVTIGYYLPHEVPETRGGTLNTPFKWNPDVWGGYFDERGYVVAADMLSGVYVLRFDASPHP